MGYVRCFLSRDELLTNEAIAAASKALRRQYGLGGLLLAWPVRPLEAFDSLLEEQFQFDQILYNDIMPNAVTHVDQIPDSRAARAAYFRGHYRYAAERFARNWEETGNAEPLGLYRAACAAALAGSGESADAKNCSQGERRQLLNYALDWLEYEVGRYRVWAARRGPIARDQLPNLRQWQHSKQLACVRDELFLTVTDEAQVDWRVLWDDVASALEDRHSK